MINSLKGNQIFVFGSNLSGHHLGGAARQAKEQFGAEEGIGQGLTGRCYAFPTLDRNFGKFSESELKTSRDELYTVCENNLDKEFLLTKVGTGIAGYLEETMKSLFLNPPSNLILPAEWK